MTVLATSGVTSRLPEPDLSEMAAKTEDGGQVGGCSFVALLLLVPFIGLLWLPFYSHAEPPLFGFPFFYWYQLLWVPLSSLITYVVWRATRRAGDQ